jgi:putative ABC transport system permease protein
MKFPFWSRKRRDAELNEEIQAHLALGTREQMESGESRKYAALNARREFGNETLARETTHDNWGWRWLGDFFQDLRYGLRLLGKNPGFTAVAILTLALGIGANTAIFSLIDAVMLKMLPVQNPQELRLIGRLLPGSNGKPSTTLTNPIWEAVREHADGFTGIFAWSTTTFNLASGGKTRLVPALYVSGDYFDTLGVRPVVGRLINVSDDRRDCLGAAVLSYGFWQARYGGSPGAIGSMISLESHPFQIIGVASAGFSGLDVGSNFDVAVPVCAERIVDGKQNAIDDRRWWWLTAMGRAKSGVSPEQLNARLQVISPQVFAMTVPRDWKPDLQANFLKRVLVGMPAGSGVSEVRRAYDQPLRMLMAIVGLILLIACANIASLMLSRAAARRKEISLRLALGASRSRLIRQLLTECVLLSSAGAILGVLFARWSSALLPRFISTSGNPVFLDLSLSRPVLGFTAAVAVLTGLIFGIFPALRSTKVSLGSAMKGCQTNENQSGAHFRPGRWIAAVQVALSLILVIVAGLFVRSFMNLLTLDPGFDRTNVLIVSANFHNAEVTPGARAQLYQQILEHLTALPGVTSASESVMTPIGRRVWDSVFYREDGSGPHGDSALATINAVSPGYFATLRSDILSGRNFEESDTVNSPLVAIVNETMAHKFFPHTIPIGQSVREDVDPGQISPLFQIVGVLKDAKYSSLRETTPPTIYFPFLQLSRQPHRTMTESPQFMLRTTSPPPAITQAATTVITGINHSISLDFHTLEERVDDSLRQEKLLATLSGFFGGLALLLAMIGLYGVLAYMVTQRRKEIGIRMALGASGNSILSLIMRDVSILLAVGVAVGVGISLWATHFMQKMLFNLNPRDAKTIIFSVAVLSAVALLAGYLPARRAARLNPNVILRDE